MQGGFWKFWWQLPPAFSHEHGDDHEKIRRYKIGESRLAFLRQNVEPFAYLDKPDGERVVAFLAIVDESDLDPDMPNDTRCEYLAGSIRPDGSTVLYAYLWFRTLDDAKQYAQRHGMKLQGGWSDEKG